MHYTNGCTESDGWFSRTRSEETWSAVKRVEGEAEQVGTREIMVLQSCKVSQIATFE